MKIIFKKVHEDAVIPEFAYQGDAGLDLRLLEDTFVPAGGVVLARTGLSVQLPANTVGLIYIRSSTATKFLINLANSVGVIDQGYRGEIKVPLKAISSSRSLRKGSKVAQLVVTPLVADLLVEEATELGVTTRGSGGFGSSGA